MCFQLDSYWPGDCIFSGIQVRRTELRDIPMEINFLAASANLPFSLRANAGLASFEIAPSANMGSHTGYRDRDDDIVWVASAHDDDSLAFPALLNLQHNQPQSEPDDSHCGNRSRKRRARLSDTRTDTSMPTSMHGRLINVYA